jgi:predicted O-methyltransferase YrrM
MFFFHLAEANNYEILYRHYWKAPGSDYSLPAPSEMTNHGWPEDWFQDWGIEFIFRKGTSDPFRLPVETGTASGTIDKAFLNEKGVEIQLLEGITGSTMTDAPTEHEWERQTVHSMNSAVAALQICNVAHPKIDLAAADPIAEIVGSAEFNSLVHFFATSEAAQRALVGPSSQALLYCIIRNLVPDHVFEIGTYKASTTEAICRALWANGHGIAHTVDPYEYGVGDIFAAWPAKLREHVLFYPMNSMAFYIQAIQTDLRPDLVFVDGHHDYEFALFDIECAARLMKPNGFIFIDNIAQPGPYFAARDFLETHPHWREHGASMNSYRPEFAFDPARRTVEHTDFCILRAPRQVFVGIEPFTPGTSVWHNSMVDGISLPISRPATGKLHVQCILRSFGEPLTETAFERSIELAGAVGEVKFSLAIPFRPELISARCTVEPWLTWVGDAPLELTSNPILY